MQLTGNTHIVLKNSEIIGSYMYEPFGKQFTLFSESQTRLSFISKEKDIESELSDFGVRKYDNEIGWFTSIDPLWEKYYSWTPYHYCSNNPVMGKDPSGLLPGDPFDTPEQAAHDFGKNYNSLSIEDKVEYSATIYKIGENQYTYTIPRSWEQKECTWDEKGNQVAYVHTHGAYIEGYTKMDEFSKTQVHKNGDKSGDIYTSEKENLPVFLVTPNGVLKGYYPDTNTEKIITKDMPRDPNDPKTKQNTTPVVENKETRPIPFYVKNALGYGERTK
jgi:RHS repeat-associated protein